VENLGDDWPELRTARSLIRAGHEPRGAVPSRRPFDRAAGYWTRRSRVPGRAVARCCRATRRSNSMNNVRISGRPDDRDRAYGRSDGDGDRYGGAVGGTAPAGEGQRERENLGRAAPPGRPIGSCSLQLTRAAPALSCPTKETPVQMDAASRCRVQPRDGQVPGTRPVERRRKHRVQRSCCAPSMTSFLLTRVRPAIRDDHRHIPGTRPERGPQCRLYNTDNFRFGLRQESHISTPVSHTAAQYPPPFRHAG